MKKNSFYLILIPFLFLVSCSKEDLKPKRFLLKDITYTNLTTNLPEYKEIYEYNTEGKITEFIAHDWDSLGVERLLSKATYEYNSGQIIRNSYDENNSLVYIAYMTLGSNGFVNREEFYSGVTMFHERNFMYNNDGYLINMEDYDYDSYTYFSTTNEIQNENTKREVYQYTYSDGSTSSVSYDNRFDINISNPFSSTNLVVKGGFPTINFGFYGRPNKNFITNIDELDYSTTGSITYYAYRIKYTIDGNGNVESIIYSMGNGDGTFSDYSVQLNYLTIN
jgi:hypothetical protein